MSDNPRWYVFLLDKSNDFEVANKIEIRIRGDF